MAFKGLSQLESLLAGKVSFKTDDLLSHAGDLWPRRLLSQRLGQKIEMPLAVVRPTSIEDVKQCLRWANQEKISIVPFGGGSGVCGAVQTPGGGSIVLDLRGLKSVKEINTESLYVTAEAGIGGGDLETALNREGLTLGHFPTSYAISTLGGWISTRAAGHFSSAYGGIEEMLLSLKVVLANGEVLETKLVPRRSTGPSLQELFLGAEGTLGVIVEASCQVQKLPAQREYLSFSFDQLSKGLSSVRALVQGGVSPAVIRLYDETDTRVVFGEMGTPRVGIEAKGNLLVLVFQGERELVEFQKQMARKFFLKEGSVSDTRDLGEGPAKRWWEHRFDLNEKKMMQILSQQGMILDTIEVAATWSHLETLYQKMKEAIGGAPSASGGILVMAHFSHFYLTGGSIYFTFVGSVEEEQALASYDTIWKKAMEACLDAKGTISHHHGIGLLKKAWIKRELNEGWELLSKIKKTMDPNNILNPGKWI